MKPSLFVGFQNLFLSLSCSEKALRWLTEIQRLQQEDVTLKEESKNKNKNEDKVGNGA